MKEAQFYTLLIKSDFVPRELPKYQPYLLFLESLTKPTKATTAETKEKEGHSISQQSPDHSGSGQSRRSKYDKKLKARLIKTQDRLSQVWPLTQFFSVSSW